MDVIIDGTRTHSFENPPADIIAALAEVSSTLQSEGRAIVAMVVDGRQISADGLADTLGTKTPDEIGTIEVTSEDISVLVRQSLDDLEETLPNLPQACHELARVFQGTDPSQGYEPFQRLAELWGHVKEREKMVANALGIDLDTMETGHAAIRSLHENLNSVLDDAARAIECNDLVLLGDLLEYELAPRAESEAEIVAFLKEQAQERAS